MKPRMILSRLAAIVLCLCTVVTVRAQADGGADSERLREREEIVPQQNLARVQAEDFLLAFLTSRTT